MQCVSISAERQPTAEVNIRDGTARIIIRTGAKEVPQAEGGKAWECAEATMELPAQDAPTVEEIMEDVDGWFDYAAEWTQPTTKTIEQLQADLEYLAAVMGIDLEV